MIAALIALVFVIVGALANRFAGGGYGWTALAKDHGGPLPGRPIYYVGAALIVALWFAFGWLGALAALSFVLWRLPAWPTLQPRTIEEAWALFVRGLMALPVFVALAFLGEFGKALLLFALSAGIVAAFLFATHARLGPGDRLPVAEPLAGAVWGLVIAAVLLPP